MIQKDVEFGKRKGKGKEGGNVRGSIDREE